jgi:hypothetical protein
MAKESVDFTARVFQHKYNHLNGIVLLGRSERARHVSMEKEFQKLIHRNENEQSQKLGLAFYPKERIIELIRSGSIAGRY